MTQIDILKRKFWKIMILEKTDMKKANSEKAKNEKGEL